MIKDSLISFVGIVKRYIQVRFQIKKAAAHKIASTVYPTVDHMRKISLKAFKSNLKRRACLLYKEIENLYPVEGESPNVVSKREQLRVCERLLLTPCKFSMLVTF